MKGQSRVFEQVLLFGISVAIFVACFGIFQLYQGHFSYISTNDNLVALGNVLYSHITEITRIDNMNTSLVVSIPKDIGGERYDISINDTDLLILTKETDQKSITRMNLIGTGLSGQYHLSGETTSGRGEIIIYKRGYNIIIE